LLVAWKTGLAIRKSQIKLIHYEVVAAKGSSGGGGGVGGGGGGSSSNGVSTNSSNSRSSGLSYDVSFFLIVLVCGLYLSSVSLVLRVVRLL
jgi:hypothetical protein